MKMTLQNHSMHQILIERDLVSSEDLAQAERLQEETGDCLEHALLRYGAISEDLLLEVQSKQLGVPLLKEIPTEAIFFHEAAARLKISHRWLVANETIVWAQGESVFASGRRLNKPNIRETLERSSFDHGVDLTYCLVPSPLLESALYNFRAPEIDHEAVDTNTQRLRELAEEAPVIDFVNRIFAHALKHRASDIHIEPFESRFQVRYRIDGALRSGPVEPRSKFDAVVSRVKLLSRMDIAERRLPQDGRQTIRFAGAEVDLRVSSLPGSWGESLVMRLLKKDNTLADLSSLGLEGRSAAVMNRLLQFSNGIVLVTGPTGSGKSTTLYRSLQGLNDGIRKIITIEDPVEYDMDGVVQIPINASIGYTFAKGLRAILRQDPDIIMVGEIRDGDTATIAAQASLTGHLVISTMHTNSALAGVARLIDIGMEPYMIASAVRGLAAQRLVRRLCDDCSVPSERPDIETQIFDLLENGSNFADALDGTPNYQSAVGCIKCGNTGYVNRVALFEVTEVDEVLSEAIFAGHNIQQLTRLARGNGFVSLLEDGLLKARRGLTTVEEVFRVCGEPVPVGKK